jgi:predicted metallopeptidase
MEEDKVRPLKLAVPNWEGTYVVNEDYRPIAEALVKKYEEIAHIPVDAVLFIENTKSKAMHRGRAKYAQIGKIPARWQETLCQLTGNDLIYFMEIFKQHTQYMIPAQIVALVYHELRHIDRSWELCAHDIEDWGLMVSKLGLGWHRDDNIPNLLDEGVNWDNICGVGQQRLFQDIMPNGIDSMEIKVRKDDDTKDSNEKRNLQIVK